MDTVEKDACVSVRDFEKLLEASIDAIVSMNEADRITLWNPAAERMFGYTRAEAYAMTVSELMPEEYRNRHIDGTRRFIETGAPSLIGKTIEITALRKDGAVFPIEMSLAAEKTGKAWSFVSVIRDITGRKKIEEEMVMRNALLNKANSELGALFKVSEAISHTMDMDALLNAILLTVTGLEIFNVEKKGGIFLVEDGRMRLKAHIGHTEEFVAMHSGMMAGECLCGLAASTGEIVISSNSEEDRRHTIKSDMEAHGHIILPLKSDGATLGVLYLYLSAGEEVDELHRNILVAIGNQLGVAINNSKLYEQTKELSLNDPLTGLANRRLMYIELQRNLVLARRCGNPFSVIMMDIDHFKRYNDAHGHLAGDRLLEEFAKTLASATRETDLRVRYGGEEFLVLLPDTEIKTALEVAERIRKTVERGRSLTVSLGVSAFNLEIKQGIEIINKADAAMYLAKCNGRNRVEAMT